jgi:hypothetical protein
MNDLVDRYDVTNRTTKAVLLTGSLDECNSFIADQTDQTDLVVVSRETTEEV